MFLVDNPRIEIADPYVIRRGSDLELRRLHDGREFQVVEVFYEPEELRSLLDDEGWTARLDATRWFTRTRPLASSAAAWRYRRTIRRTS